MFMMAFGVHEMAVGRIQVAKHCQDKFYRVLIFAVWDIFANIAKNLYTAKVSVYTVSCKYI